MEHFILGLSDQLARADSLAAASTPRAVQPEAKIRIISMGEAH